MSDIDANVKALTEAFENDDNEAAKAAVVALVSGVFKDLRRIADGVTRLAQPPEYETGVPADKDIVG